MKKIFFHLEGDFFLGILNDRNNYDKISENFRLIGRLKKSKLL